jgi:Trk K+ transport system NAD-binding subunit
VATESWIARSLRSGGPKRTAQRGREVLRRQVDTTRLGLLNSGNGPPKRHLIVCGDDPLAHRLVEELVRRYRVKVTVILANRRRNHGPQIDALPEVHVVEADRLDIDAFRRARVDTAEALALVHQNDVGNIDAALQVKELNPNLRLVVRMFNMSLGGGLRQLFPDSRVLSDAAMAAPEFVSAALGEVAPVHVRLPGRTLYVAHRSDVRRDDVVCGLAKVHNGERPKLLPADPDQADLVLAVATGTRARVAMLEQVAGAEGTAEMILQGDQPVGRRRAAVAAWLLRWRRRGPLGALPMLINRKLRITALVLFSLLVIGTGTLKVTEGTSWLNAAYLAILDTLAGANPDVAARPIVKVTETVLTVVSILLIPIITAAIVEAAVNARLALALGRLKGPVANHVVVVGLGNVGSRVLRRLHDLGVQAVAIDRNEEARGIPVARELRIPYIIGDASDKETLRAASVRTCRALLVVSTDDATNLATALQGRAIKEDLRVVLRLFDGDFARRVQRAFGVTMSRSVSFLAAPAFTAAMLERAVIGTIPVGRNVLLLAEVPVGTGSELVGAALRDAGEAGESRVIAIMEDRRRKTVWKLDPRRPLRPDDVLIVVATRAGLGRLLSRTAPPRDDVQALA